MVPPALNPDLEVLLRLGTAVLCGVAVGVNRAHHGNQPHPNRVRVHVLVGLSACLMVLAAGHGADPRSRVIQGVASGVGFLGAGEILVAPPRGRSHPPEVHGLSSAASIWFTAALGVTVAASRPALALVALLLALITLSDRLPGRGEGGGPPGARPDSGREAERSHGGPPPGDGSAGKANGGHPSGGSPPLGGGHPSGGSHPSEGGYHPSGGHHPEGDHHPGGGHHR